MTEPKPQYIRPSKAVATSRALRQNEKLKAARDALTQRAEAAERERDGALVKIQKWNDHYQSLSNRFDESATNLLFCRMALADVQRWAKAWKAKAKELFFLYGLADGISAIHARDLATLRDKLEKARTALKMYADHQNWDGDPNRDLWLPTNDGWVRAEIALKELDDV